MTLGKKPRLTVELHKDFFCVSVKKMTASLLPPENMGWRYLSSLGCFFLIDNVRITSNLPYTHFSPWEDPNNPPLYLKLIQTGIPHAYWFGDLPDRTIYEGFAIRHRFKWCGGDKYYNIRDKETTPSYWEFTNRRVL